MSNNVIEVKNLVKFYNKFQALKDISFNVPEGTIFTIVGPNGAGKTTTVEIIEGIRKYNSGEVMILGEKIGSDYVKENVGVQLQDGQLMDNLKPLEILEIFRSVYKKGFKPEDVLKLVELEHKKNTYIKNLSGGEKKRLQIALAVINDPQIIFLDEPTTGLDPNVRRKLWEIIIKFKKQKKTIVLTTHYMDEAEKLSDLVLVLNKGEVVSLDAPENLIKNSGIENKITIDFKKSLFNNDKKDKFDQFLNSINDLINKTVNKNETYIFYSNHIEKFLSSFFTFIKKENIEIENIFIKHPSLDDVFLLKTGEVYNENMQNGEKI